MIKEIRNKKISWGSVTIEAVDLEKLDFDKSVLAHTTNRYFLKLFGVEYDENNERLLFTEEFIDTTKISLNTIRRRNINYL